MSLLGSAAPPPQAEKRLNWNQPWLFLMWDVAESKQEGSRKLPVSSCFSQQRCGVGFFFFFPSSEDDTSFQGVFNL